jgi:hypothetical protein
MIFRPESSSSSSEEEEIDENDPIKSVPINFDLLPQKNPQDTLFEQSLMDMDKFFEKINLFEKITN